MAKDIQDIVVIGGGASGLMAGITAARNGSRVTILEHKDRIGKKILSTGNGKCNLTNLDQKPEHYRGEHPEFAMNLLKQFGVTETLEFFKGLGIFPKNKNGYIYPNSEQAASVLDVLRMEAEHLKIKIICETEIKGIKKTGAGFCIQAGTGSYECRRLIVAAGSKAAPVTGSDGSGYKIAADFGHRIITPVPALVQLRAKEDFFKSLAGIRTEAAITLFINGSKTAWETGELQLTDYGISGIPVFQISRFAARGLESGCRVSTEIDFMPEVNEHDLTDMLFARICNCPYKDAEEMMNGLLNKKLNAVLLRQAGIPLHAPSDSLKKDEVRKLAEKMKKFTVTIKETNPFANAQICAGGVDTTELDDETLESKLVKGLYFSGEIIDIDGTCGGYNLQWAWTSGYVAGMSSSSKRAL